MVRIKFTARPRTPVVSPKFAPMASNDVLEVSTKQRETSANHLEESLTGRQMVASTEAISEQDVETDRESQSSDFGDSETASDNSVRLKVAATAALAGISYDFGPSTIMKARLGSLENNTHYFPKGYERPPGAESVLVPRANEVVVFEDFFTAGLHMLPHLVLVDILHKFRVQLHQLTPNAIVQIGKFIWVVASCGDRPTTDVFAHHYQLHYQNKKNHLAGSILLSPHNLVVFVFTPLSLEVEQGLPLL
jgi:hypothetical protein